MRVKWARTASPPRGDRCQGSATRSASGRPAAPAPTALLHLGADEACTAGAACRSALACSQQCIAELPGLGCAFN